MFKLKKQYVLTCTLHKVNYYLFTIKQKGLFVLHYRTLNSGSAKQYNILQAVLVSLFIEFTQKYIGIVSITKQPTTEYFNEGTPFNNMQQSNTHCKHVRGNIIIQNKVTYAQCKLCGVLYQ